MKKTSLSLISMLIAGAIIAGCNSETDQSSTNVVKGNEKTQTSEVLSETVVSEEDNINYYFTANEGGSISKINASTDEVENTIEVDGVVHNVQVSPDGKMLGATVIPGGGDSHDDTHGDDTHGDDSHQEDSHGDSHSEGAIGQALFFDIETNELLRTVEVGNHPAHFVFTEDGKYAVVTNAEDNNVSVIEMESLSVTHTIETGKGPHGLRISADSKKAYVANMNEDTISVIDLETMKEERKITVGSTPVTTAITSDGKTLVTTLHVENMLAIIDLETDQVETVEVGKGPAQVYIDGNNQYAYVANQGTAEVPSSSVNVVDLDSLTVTATIETGKGAHGVVISSDNKRLYVTNMFENTVTVIDIERNEAINTFEVGEIPNGISIMK
ncbi:beta-propeller fold lactonase family protein [Bacillus sp. PS06]|uniref:YVTN family beta-propeller repeat protein n=1 Tax=Bacillus sp. PS06 TaxID=2764176 RepID=UPI00177E52AF|nr:beta-propeller fold lactonase family protein [Bacillus sp. PS06]MBD8071292.1 beta-propeller fold lactonase family protein [Bacillus sp. PS06]